MNVGSVCSGIEAATVAWEPLGFRFAWYSEIEPFCCSLLDHHYPDTPNLGDITKITEADLERHGSVDTLVGGTPCQSFSVAGLRKGLDDPRGNLAVRFLQLVGTTRPRWVCWENVPGVLSSGKGRDFGTFLGALAELGYGFAYRVLDAQYFGVPQRRRRVFVVGHLGDWRRAAAVLFERESLRRNPAPSREAGAGVAACFTAGAHPGGHNGQDDCKKGRLIPIPIHNPGLTDRDSNRDGAGIGEPDRPMFTVQARPRDAIAYRTSGNCGVMEQGDKTAALNCNTDPTQQIIAYQCHGTNVGEMGTLRTGNQGVTGGVPFVVRDERGRCNDGRVSEDSTFPLHATKGPSEQQTLVSGMAVRRLTPRECERLQGFPDDYTLIPWRGKPREQCPDGPRYRVLGNAFPVPVMRWIGERIAMVEAIL